jgi:AcrR family transcriptional regulator
VPVAVVSARERLLAAAHELFYAEGVQTVGIDRVIERAGVAKASLYNVFGSKEELIRAYLEERHAGTLGALREAVARHADPRARLLAVFDAQAEVFAQPGFRGCAFASAGAEAPAGGLIQEAATSYRLEIHELLVELAEAAGARDAAALASQLQIVYDGAGLSARMDRDPAIAVAARAAAESLLDAQLRTERARRGANVHS